MILLETILAPDLVIPLTALQEIVSAIYLISNSMECH